MNRSIFLSAAEVCFTTTAAAVVQVKKRRTVAKAKNNNDQDNNDPEPVLVGHTIIAHGLHLL